MRPQSTAECVGLPFFSSITSGFSARITAKASQMLQHTEGTSRWVVCVGVGVVLVAGESSISREVDHDVFTLVVSPTIRLDKYQPRLPKRVS